MSRPEDSTPIERRKVSSSVVASVGYDPATRSLTVEFLSKQLYVYHDVPEEIFLGLLDPPGGSVGQFFGKHVRDVYAFTKLT